MRESTLREPHGRKGTRPHDPGDRGTVQEPRGASENQETTGVPQLPGTPRAPRAGGRIRRTRRAAADALRGGVRRIDEATPVDRDRAVDALRALAILGVVLGHWLVTALVADGGALHAASPLRHMPWLAPISWVFQTLAVFFLVGGALLVLVDVAAGQAAARQSDANAGAQP